MNESTNQEPLLTQFHELVDAYGQAAVKAGKENPHDPVLVGASVIEMQAAEDELLRVGHELAERRVAIPSVIDHTLLASVKEMLHYYAPGAQEGAERNGEDSLHSAVRNARRAVREAEAAQTPLPHDDALKLMWASLALSPLVHTGLRGRDWHELRPEEKEGFARLTLALLDGLATDILAAGDELATGPKDED